MPSKTCPVRPLNDRVLVRVEETVTETPGGIILPDVAQEKPLRGQVVSVGPGRLKDDGSRIPMGVSVGDTVFFTRYAGSPVPQEVAGKDLLVMNESDILGVVESEASCRSQKSCC